jgi:hypothetical protein
MREQSTITVYVAYLPKNYATDADGWENNQILGVYPSRAYAQKIINQQFGPARWCILEFELDTNIMPR